MVLLRLQTPSIPHFVKSPLTLHLDRPRKLMLPRQTKQNLRIQQRRANHRLLRHANISLPLWQRNRLWHIQCLQKGRVNACWDVHTGDTAPSNTEFGPDWRTDGIVEPGIRRPLGDGLNVVLCHDCAEKQFELVGCEEAARAPKIVSISLPIWTLWG